MSDAGSDTVRVWSNEEARCGDEQYTNRKFGTEIAQPQPPLHFERTMYTRQLTRSPIRKKTDVLRDLRRTRPIYVESRGQNVQVAANREKRQKRVQLMCPIAAHIKDTL